MTSASARFFMINVAILELFDVNYARFPLSATPSFNQSGFLLQFFEQFYRFLSGKTELLHNVVDRIYDENEAILGIFSKIV